MWTVDDYIREEVRRQGHDLNDARDGGLRVQWMTAAWQHAISRQVERPDYWDIIDLGRMVEPRKNMAGLRQVDVRVGWSRLCPPPDLIPDMLRRLCDHSSELVPLDFYRELELIHPFVDGNGRTGKIVLNWLAGTLQAPWFPPADFWGTPILNP